MNLLRFAAQGASKSLLLKNSYRCASYNAAIHRGINREARAASTFDRGRRDRDSKPSYDRDRDGGAPRSYNRDSDDGAKPYSRDREGSSKPPYSPYSRDREGGSRPPYNREDGGSSRPPFKRDYEGGSSRPPFNREGGGSSRPPFKRDYEGGSSRPPFNREGGGSSRPPFKRDYEGGSSRPPFKRDYEGDSSRPPFNSDRDASSPRTFGRDREPSSRPFHRDSDSSPRYSKDREPYSKSSFTREDGFSARTFNNDDQNNAAPRSFNRDRDASSPRPFNRDSESSPRPYNRDRERPTTDSGDDRYAAPEHTHTPRRTIQKVNQESEWIYGTSVVEAALKSSRRQLFRLHICAGENRTAASRERDIKLKNLARGLKIDVREVEDTSTLDSMSNSRPHNGYVLEASKLLKTPIISLSKVSFDKTTFGLQIAQHDFTESGLNLNELPQTIPNRDPTRYPLVLMLDEILDPGNLGAILRSAYFLGCSALLVTERNCAPLSPVCLKSSAGASEYLPILTHITPPRLITSSKGAGWKFFAAAPRPAKHATNKYIDTNHKVVQEALDKGPVVLLMGGEGEGLRDSIKKLCDKCISVTAAKDVDRGVDSLNVSVAAGVLMQALLGDKKAATAGAKEDAKAESGIAAAEEGLEVAEDAAVDESVEIEGEEAVGSAETAETVESESAKST